MDLIVFNNKKAFFST